MAKRKKPLPPEYGNALNASDDFKEQVVMMSEVYDGEGDPRVGVMVLNTEAGHYQFLITETRANELIQLLRDFIAEEAERLP